MQENQVVRHSKRAHDGHLHLCVYVLDPLSFVDRPLAKPRAPIQIPSKPRANGAIALHAPHNPPCQSSLSPKAVSDLPGDGMCELGLSEVDLRAIRRLSRRVNVLPVIGRADELTVARLGEAKRAVKRDLAKLGIGWGAFAPNEGKDGESSGREESGQERRGRVDGITSRSIKSSDASSEAQIATAREPTTTVAVPGGIPHDLADGDDDEATPKATAVADPPAERVKLIRVRSRSRGMARNLSSKTIVTEVESEEEDEEDEVDYGGMVPFAIVAPDDGAGAAGTGTGPGRFVREFR